MQTAAVPPQQRQCRHNSGSAATTAVVPPQQRQCRHNRWRHTEEHYNYASSTYVKLSTNLHTACSEINTILIAVLREDIAVSQNHASWIARVPKFWRQTEQTLTVQKEANTDTKTLRYFVMHYWCFRRL
jgi:hypothetical protein